MDKKDEYLMLREEILHLDTIINNTINFFYVFIVSYIAFSLTQNDTIFLLLSYMVIYPAYLIVLSKMQGLCKIGAYLYVFHENKKDAVFKWEQRSVQYGNNNKNIFSYIISSHFPFLLVSCAVMILFFYSTKWDNIYSIYEIIKIIICICLNLILLIITVRNRKISTNDYVEKWEEIE